MTYVYLLQPAEYLNTNCYKIGISSTCNLNRLKSYDRYVFLFKHLNELHNDNILLEFIQRSRRQDHLNMSKDFKPVSVLKQRYPGFYKSLEKDAMKFINKYIESYRLASISTFNR